jgi:hypothetical protein
MHDVFVVGVYSHTPLRAVRRFFLALRLFPANRKQEYKYVGFFQFFLLAQAAQILLDIATASISGQGKKTLD